jgi:hypothetical protein
MSAARGVTVRPRLIAIGLLAIAMGAAVGYVDSRPGWDDTGITAGLLLLAAALVAAIDGRRPWLWALLVGLPLPIIEVSGSGPVGSIASLLFAAVGATIGWLVGRTSGSREAAG